MGSESFKAWEKHFFVEMLISLYNSDIYCLGLHTPDETVRFCHRKLFSLVFIFIGVNVFLSGYFTALGNGFISTLISSLRSCILVVIFILILPKIMGGVSGVWLTMPLAEAVTIFIAVYLYRTHEKRS